MIICIDITTLYKEKRGKAIDLIERLSKIKNENLVEIYNWWYIEDQMIFVEAETPVYSIPNGPEDKKQGHKQDNKSWKTYCKRKF